MEHKNINVSDILHFTKQAILQRCLTSFFAKSISINDRGVDISVLISDKQCSIAKIHL